MGVRIAAGRDPTLFRIVLVDKQAATAINKTLPCAVFQVMGEDLAETVVGEFFVGSGGIGV